MFAAITQFLHKEDSQRSKDSVNKEKLQDWIKYTDPDEDINLAGRKEFLEIEKSILKTIDKQLKDSLTLSAKESFELLKKLRKEYGVTGSI